MAYRCVDKEGPSRRRSSDDVTSLDSWSELAADNPRAYVDNNYGHSEAKLSSKLLLNPQSLAPGIEPLEPKVTRVKLFKGNVSQGHGWNSKSTGTPKLLRIFSRGVDSGMSDLGLRNETIHEKHECKESNIQYEVKQQQPQAIFNRDIASLYEDTQPKSLPINPHTPNASHLSNACGCIHCIETAESYKSLPVFPSFDDSCLDTMKSSQPYLKKHASTPFLQNALSKKHHAEDGEVEQSEKVKNKIISVWNNVRYGWTLKTKTNFEKDSPIFLLGRCYHIRPDDEEPDPGQRVHTPPSIELFKRDFQSRLWFTYRRDFQALAQTKLTSDCGWGCMLRSSQMMLAQAFICHFLGRGWRLHTQTKEQETFYRHIIQWFGDSSNDLCPFSVHRLVEIGKMFGKQPGEWYGPSSVAYIIRDAVFKASMSQPVLKDLCVYVAQDCTVYKQDVINLCCQRARNFTSSLDTVSPDVQSSSVTLTDHESSEHNTEWKRSVIILIPVRLGGEEFNPIYSPCIKNLMAHESCLGLIGGKPKHSLYFIGWQEEKLIYLDPHFCQDYVDVLKRDFKISSFHCYSPRKISLKKMDPSATVGFYCKTREDFNKFVEHMDEMVTPNKGSGLYPMFVFNDGKGSDININDLSLSEKSLCVRRVTLDEHGRIRTSSYDSEEFVVL